MWVEVQLEVEYNLRSNDRDRLQCTIEEDIQLSIQKVSEMTMRSLTGLEEDSPIPKADSPVPVGV